MPADIFICYSSHDRAQALRLVGELRARGYSVWIDQDGIHGAGRWSTEIVNAIHDCKLLAVLLSRRSLASANVVKEVSLAAERNKRILPLVLEAAELNHDFAYHLAGLQQVAIENTEAILRTLQNTERGAGRRLQ